MNRPQYTIRSLLVATLVLGLVFALFRTADLWLGFALYSLFPLTLWALAAWRLAVWLIPAFQRIGPRSRVLAYLHGCAAAIAAMIVSALVLGLLFLLVAWILDIGRVRR
jgi:hypothetical protein